MFVSALGGEPTMLTSLTRHSDPSRPLEARGGDISAEKAEIE